MWIQEVRVGGRLAYKKVLGTKNPADVLTKHVPGELLERHLESIGAEPRSGRAETAPELNSVESLVLRLPADWKAEIAGGATETGAIESTARTRRVSWARQVHLRAVPAVGKSRPVTRKSRSQHQAVTPVVKTAGEKDGQFRGGAAEDSSVPGGAGRRSWADLTEDQYGP